MHLFITGMFLKVSPRCIGCLVSLSELMINDLQVVVWLDNLSVAWICLVAKNLLGTWPFHLLHAATALAYVAFCRMDALYSTNRIAMQKRGTKPALQFFRHVARSSKWTICLPSTSSSKLKSSTGKRVATTFGTSHFNWHDDSILWRIFQFTIDFSMIGAASTCLACWAMRLKQSLR